MSSLMDLPEDVLKVILRNSTFQEQVHLGRTCKTLLALFLEMIHSVPDENTVRLLQSPSFVDILPSITKNTNRIYIDSIKKDSSSFDVIRDMLPSNKFVIYQCLVISLDECWDMPKLEPDEDGDLIIDSKNGTSI